LTQSRAARRLLDFFKPICHSTLWIFEFSILIEKKGICLFLTFDPSMRKNERNCSLDDDCLAAKQQFQGLELRISRGCQRGLLPAGNRLPAPKVIDQGPAALIGRTTIGRKVSLTPRIDCELNEVVH
jgi:hypothetical protein